MSRHVYRYQVPVDDQPHLFRLTGDPLAVAAATVDAVEFWAEQDTDGSPADRVFRVFGTGHRIPPGARYVGTCNRVNGFVWHLYEVAR